MVFACRQIVRYALVIPTLALFGCTHTASVTDDVSIRALQSRQARSALTLVKPLAATEQHRASLMSYTADGLRQFTLMLRPTAAVGQGGYPVVIFGHGFHPEPRKHGVSAVTGKDWRPGDYYRGVPEAYAAQGYLVLAPDYRGHNKSQGFAFTQTSFLATSYYASDVLHLLAALPSLPDADRSRVFFVGHSMGAEVGLKTLLATDAIRAASLWSPATASTLQQALYYGRYDDNTTAAVEPATMADYLKNITEVYARHAPSVNFAQVDPIENLGAVHAPLIIHHARGDRSAPYLWSENLVARLHQLGKDYALYTYATDDHLLADDQRAQAVARDVAFFRRH